MSITFQVIDLNCEVADQSFFIPIVTLSTKSTSTFASVKGWNEFVPSSPPKRYKKVTLAGSSKRIGFTAEATPRQCAGAKFVFSGVGQIDNTGKLINNYSKDFYAQCGKAYWPPEPSVQDNPAATTTNDFGSIFPVFIGYCWPDDTLSCPVCPPNEADWSFINDYAKNNTQPNLLGVDLQAFHHTPGSVVLTNTTFSISDSFSGLTSLGNFVDPAFPNQVPLPPLPSGFPQETLDAQGNLLPDIGFGGFIGGYIRWTNYNFYSAVLSDEYTDTEAAANATVVIGTGNTAQTFPRSTGFTSVTTSVVFTVHASNLVVGKDYVITVDFWEQGPNFLNEHTTMEYPFTAIDVTYDLTDVVPTPAIDHTITVQKPTIAFATL